MKNTNDKKKKKHVRQSVRNSVKDRVVYYL